MPSCDRARQPRFEALRARLILVSHRDLRYATRLLNRLERLGDRVDAPGLSSLVRDLRVGLLHEMMRVLPQQHGNPEQASGF